MFGNTVITARGVQAYSQSWNSSSIQGDESLRNSCGRNIQGGNTIRNLSVSPTPTLAVNIGKVVQNILLYSSPVILCKSPWPPQKILSIQFPKTHLLNLPDALLKASISMFLQYVQLWCYFIYTIPVPPLLSCMWEALQTVGAGCNSAHRHSKWINSDPAAFNMARRPGCSTHTAREKMLISASNTRRNALTTQTHTGACRWTHPCTHTKTYEHYSYVYSTLSI